MYVTGKQTNQHQQHGYPQRMRVLICIINMHDDDYYDDDNEEEGCIGYCMNCISNYIAQKNEKKRLWQNSHPRPVAW